MTLHIGDEGSNTAEPGAISPKGSSTGETVYEGKNKKIRSKLPKPGRSGGGGPSGVPGFASPGIPKPVSKKKRSKIIPGGMI